MSKLIVANWKMYPQAESEAKILAKNSDFPNVIVCPPFPFLGAVKSVIKKAKLGAQDVFWFVKGPYTGGVSSQMLKGLGVSYVIVGHSERRSYFGETDEMINKKVKVALKAGLKVILCVGEHWSIRKKGFASAKNFVKKQLEKDLAGTTNHKLQTTNLIIAYEPVWAIGTGRADKPEETVEMTKFIKKILFSRFHFLNSKVLYGGSVDSKNAFSFLNQPFIDGVLVGGASLKPTEFKKIVQ